MLTSTLPHHLVVIDCETTGLGSNDRIIEIAVLTLDPRTWEPTDEYETLINPERERRSRGHTRHHGIHGRGRAHLPRDYHDTGTPTSRCNPHRAQPFL